MEFIRTGMLFLKKSKSLESLIQSRLPVADSALQIKGEGGWVGASQKFFSALWASVWSTNKGGGEGGGSGPPGSFP